MRQTTRLNGRRAFAPCAFKPDGPRSCVLAWVSLDWTQDECRTERSRTEACLDI